MTLIVGLGNPGEKYLHNRHNIGFMVVDKLIDRHKALPANKSSFSADCYKSKDFIFLKPTTYMNLSGKSVLAVTNFYKPDDIVVIHDDLDLKFGALKIKRGGGNGGHNGLKSIDAMLGTEYVRIRMGIGKPEYKSQVSAHVLSDFNSDEAKDLDIWIERACEAIEALSDEEVKDVASRFSAKSIENVI
ncbi:MAG: aminoacyl-tRNA hydrolase [Campylobacterota bacterium]